MFKFAIIGLLCMINLCFSAPIDLQIGARPQGMGGAYVAVSDDINATPAGLTQLKTMEMTWMRLDPFGIDNVKIDYVAVGRSFGNLGLGVSYLQQKADLEEGKEESYNKSDMLDNVFTISLALMANEDISLGCNIKRLTITSEEGGGAGTGYDFALLYKPKVFNLKKMNFGLMVRNSSTGLKNESIPLSYRVGIDTDRYEGLRFAPYGVKAAFDIEKKKEVNKKPDDYQYHIGIEACPSYNLAVRLGNDNGDWTYGVGFILRNWKLDYAFYQEKRYSLGNSNRLSLIMRF